MSAPSTDFPASARGDSDTTAFDQALVEGFERVARTCPDRIAVDSGCHRLSYRELNEQANRLAHRLLELGPSSQKPIAILMDHDAPAIVAVVGVLKAGGVEVVLSNSDPAARLNVLLQDAGPSAIVVDAANAQLGAGIVPADCAIVPFEPVAADGATHNLSIRSDPGQTAALVYTSGATGRPKAVMQTHRQIARNVAIHSEAMRYTDSDRISLFSAIGTGHGTTGVWCALLNGATLCPFPIKVNGVAGLADWIGDRRLTVFVSSASIFRALVKTVDRRFVFAGMRAVRLSSESVSREDIESVRRHFPPACEVVHTFSSSETGNIAWHRWASHDNIPEGRLPIGKISRGIEFLLLSDDGGLVAAGEVGEIAVRSRYVANGYWCDPDLTAARFSPDLDGRGTRIVRNGDWGRINANGHFEFCGRKDDRVKIRGNRIELADIETALTKLPGIAAAAAIAIPRDKSEPLLVAFVEVAAEATWPVARLRHAVAVNLPLHMVPSRFVFLDSLPLAAGGKIDRDALRGYKLRQPSGEGGAPPQSETETLVADIWAEALDLSSVGREDDFFSLGGDSLRGAIVAAQICAAFGTEVSLAAISEHPTLSALAAFVDRSRQSEIVPTPAIVSVPRDGPMPLSPIQARAWKAHETGQGYPYVRAYRIAGPLEVDVLKACIADLFERHEILRTTFSLVDGHPAQIVHSSVPTGFSTVDISGANNKEEQAAAVVLREAAKPIDVETSPVTRHVLIKLDRQTHWLVRTTSALVHDGWSGTILMNELATLYQAKTAGMSPPIPEKNALQYVDYTIWHRSVMRSDGPAYAAMLDWWKRQFPKRAKPVKLPFRRSRRISEVDPSHGLICWRVDEMASKRLDAFARTVGATHFAVRLACFVALLADMTGRSTVVIATGFDSRNRLETRNIVGSFANLVPLVISYRRRASFYDWISSVRDRVFETEAHAGLPYEELYEQSRAAGMKPPGARVTFYISADLAEQRIGDLTVSRFPHSVGKMPWGCQVFVDQRQPQNCRVHFDAGLYPRAAMQAMIDRYVRLLENAARHPELSIGALVSMSSSNPVRRAVASHIASYRTKRRR